MDEHTEDDDAFTISNEFATVNVRKINTRNGTRLEICSPKLGYVVQLDPLELESLAWQDKETFSEFLITPFGPVDHDH
jgi:hypothetical protein